MSAVDTEIFKSGPVNIMVQEVRIQERAAGKPHDSVVRETLGDYARRHANRMYFSPKFPSLVGYVLSFWEPEEEIPHGVYLEVAPIIAAHPSGDWTIFRSQDKKDLKYRIEQWKSTNGLPTDLMTDPSRVYSVDNTEDNMYMHVGETSQGLLVYKYNLAGKTPRMARVLQMVQDPSELEDSLTQIPGPPQGMLDWANLG